MTELEQVQIIATIVRDIGVPAVIAFALIIFGWRLVKIFGDNDKRGDNLLEKALENMGGLASAINAQRTAEEARTELFLRLVDTTEKTYSQLETLTMATETVIGHVDKLSTGVDQVNSKVVNIEAVMKALRDMAERSEADHKAIAERVTENNVILNTFKAILQNTEADSAKIATIHRIASEYDPHPPKEPDSKRPATSKTGALTVVDGAKDDATVSGDAESEAA